MNITDKPTDLILTTYIFIMNFRKSAFSIKSIMVIYTMLLFLSCSHNVVDNTIIQEIVTDIDGNVYKTVKIGNQVWTVENLRVTRFNDSTPITYIKNDDTWDSTIHNKLSAFCYYNHTMNTDSIIKFGALYNWYAVDTKKIAPEGWHVPEEYEWKTLQNYLNDNGYNWDGTTTGWKIAKSLAAQSDWRPNTTPGSIGNNLYLNNKSGFSALPGGFRDNGGYFDTLGYGLWWTATSGTETGAAMCGLNYSYITLGIGGASKSDGLSIRLLMD